MVNKGIDIRPYGKKDIVASRSGKIVFYSGNFEGFGRTIIIEHKDGFLTVYSGISHAFIKPGDYVQKGSRIAEISDGNAYLHFEIRKGHLPQNPSFYLP